MKNYLKYKVTCEVAHYVNFLAVFCHIRLANEPSSVSICSLIKA